MSTMPLPPASSSLSSEATVSGIIGRFQVTERLVPETGAAAQHCEADHFISCSFCHGHCWQKRWKLFTETSKRRGLAPSPANCFYENPKVKKYKHVAPISFKPNRVGCWWKENCLQENSDSSYHLRAGL
ncbi:hypothetical protein U0070_014387 [Myodes glareolus]|uniref:Uncharacterized protein n=1 Tax=Myodes glareolus TaxID=447135 RepID=A0AAW0J6A0_MYOGA